MPQTLRGLAMLVIAPLLFFAALAVFTVGYTIHAFAQTAPAAGAPVSIWREVWTIAAPTLAVLIPTLLTALGGVLTAVLKRYIDGLDEKRLNDALHQSAFNALNFVLAKLGVALPASLDLRSPIVQEAISYVRSKNPDAITAFKLDDSALAEIILSKVPAVRAVVAAGKAAAAPAKA